MISSMISIVFALAKTPQGGLFCGLLLLVNALLAQLLPSSWSLQLGSKLVNAEFSEAQLPATLSFSSVDRALINLKQFYLHHYLPSENNSKGENFELQFAVSDGRFEMSSFKEDVYATLLLNDLYLPGALVLAHSLRDAGTKKKIAVLFTPENVSTYVQKELLNLFDYVIPVERIENEFPANLQLMNRPDLHCTFTKIKLWKQFQFRKIVYLDSDMIALRAPDELFDLPYPFSAAPDIGWPDIFNSGLMVLSPNEADYNALFSMAQKGVSFDGADQGLINMHFGNRFHRLSFTYNVTPSAHYQYVPAYQYFKSDIVMIHFIGQHKPWLQGRCKKSGSTPVDEMLNLWWAIYDQHCQKPSESKEDLSNEADNILSTHENFEYIPKEIDFISNNAPVYQANVQIKSETSSKDLESVNYKEKFAEQFAGQSARQEVRQTTEKTLKQPAEQAVTHVIKQSVERPDKIEVGHPTDKLAEQSDEQSDEKSAVQAVKQSADQSAEQTVRQSNEQPNETIYKEVNSNHLSNFCEKNRSQRDEVPTWDGRKEPPPADSRPEALNLPKTQYAMSSDPTLFKAPDRYPDPPSNMWFEVPKAPTHQKLSPIFPWEINAEKPTRVFAMDDENLLHLQMKSEKNSKLGEEVQNNDSKKAIDTIASSIPFQSMNWKSFTRVNAWDNVPEIKQYVGTLRVHNQRQIFDHRKEIDVDPQAESLNQSIFSYNKEKHILPVTPAPLRSSKLWVNDKYISQSPATQGVPSQEEWDSKAALEHLVYHQLKVMTGNIEKSSTLDREIP
ncbi:putative self-glucosylating initiator of glycogen synthesis [Erysiphe necator]|uniref:glycogenin glucosyltransferase n=1 Tax=Uncinula necator TaxID=52586 RepID=A0A0B1P4A6_UNCNE|nr:putative self-glucosylating initiator of glycogen synthesis [Erysiphe necator]